MPPPQVRVIVLISATAEWMPTKEALKPAGVDRSPYGENFRHSVGGEQVLFFHGGWGKVAAAASTEYAIGRWQPDVLINLGTCGGIEGRAERGEKLLVTRTIAYDIDEAMGDSAAAIDAYSTDLDLSWLGDALPIHARRAVLVSGDRDLVPARVPDLLRRYSAAAADWESGAIAYVAKRREIPLFILRSVSDVVNLERGEVVGDLPLFETRAAATMRALLDDLPALIPYVIERVSVMSHSRPLERRGTRRTPFER